MVPRTPIPARTNQRCFDVWRRLAPKGRGYEEAQFGLGLLYLNGYGVGRDEEAGIKWCKEAAPYEYVPAQRFLGGYLESVEIPVMLAGLSESDKMEVFRNFTLLFWNPERLKTRGLSDDEIDAVMPFYFWGFLKTGVADTWR